MSDGGVVVETKQGPVGLGGWLILPMLGLFVSPLGGLIQFTTYPDLREAWPYLTYGQSALTVGEIAMNLIVLVIAPITLLTFMFKRLEMFPGWYMIWLAAVPVFLIGDALLVYAMFPEAFADGTAEVFDKETVRGITRAAVSAVIWIPYIMQSERVANTFVR
jgi:hypothetical protein